MTEIYDCQNVRLYLTICPKCGKIFISLHKFQVIQNTIQHLKCHKVSIDPETIIVHTRDINICKEIDKLLQGD